MKNNKRISSGTLILKSLLNGKKLKSKDLRQIAFNNKTTNSYYNNMKIKNVPNGWWCVGISELRNTEMIKLDENGFNTITELGKLNINKPFSKKPIKKSSSFKF